MRSLLIYELVIDVFKERIYILYAELFIKVKRLTEITSTRTQQLSNHRLLIDP